MNRRPIAPPAKGWPHTIPTRRGLTGRALLALVLGLLTLLGLLLAYQRVLSYAVYRGDLHRQAAAVRADGIWRCNGLPSRGLRDRCLVALDPPPVDDSAMAGSFDNYAETPHELDRTATPH